MKKLFFISLVVANLIAKAQNEVGAYIFPQLSSMHNKANRQDDPIYEHLPTITYGGALTFTKQINMTKSHGPLRFASVGSNVSNHGRLISNTRLKTAVRIDAILVQHNQRFKSVYTTLGVEKTHTGAKRFNYLKIPIVYQVTIPVNKYVAYSLYGGPQISTLLKTTGGVVYWEYRENGEIYYDLPFSRTDYYKRFTLDAVLGFNLELRATRWMHLIGGIRADWSATTSDKNDAVTNNYPAYGKTNGVERKNSRNTSLALLVGFNYQIHRSEFDRTRF